MKVGATHTLDPNVEGDKLVERVRELSKGPNNRLWAGGRDSGGLLGGAGADFVLEAAGADQAPTESRSRSRSRRASCRCDRPTRCARRAATS